MAFTPTDPTALPLASILLPIFSLIAILLSLPILLWHARNRNIATSSLITWLILLNTSNFLNPLIWPTGDWKIWPSGVYYCDVQVHIIVGATIGAIPACILAISRSLARALDTRKVSTPDGKARMREMVFEGTLCVGIPVLFMVGYYVVQGVRYFLLPVYGCDNRYDASWVTVILFLVPPVIMCLASTYYTVLVFYRMYTHRRSISTLLHSSNQSKTRFLRLFILTILILAPALPSYIITLVKFLQPDPMDGSLLHPYSWSAIHTDWNQVELIPAGYGPPKWDRWSWIVYGYLIFFCFGVSGGARTEYRAWAAACGFARFFPSLQKQEEGATEIIPPSTSRSSLPSYISRKAEWFSVKRTPKTSLDADWKKISWLSSASGSSELSGSTAYELPTVEPSYQPKRANDKTTASKKSKWSSFINMPGSFAQAVAGAQNLPQRPVPSATFLTTTSSIGSTLRGDDGRKSMEYV
ncbi:GPI ethanolamine phosphate transferase 1 [Venturia nashicola]|nr:GPI ethanolamine phosphate transferase 1 [Venturia nashicola]